jgi:DNA-binding IclR family transcriptional regulator
MQSLERAAVVLRAVAAAGRRGARLADVSDASGLSRSTAHRFLLALAAAGFLEQGPGDGAFYLGLELCSLGAAAANRYELRDVARPVMRRLAANSGDTVYLSLIKGNDAICAERIEGDYPIKTLTLDVGDRRPLGVGAGSLALLAFQSEEVSAGLIRSGARARRVYPGFDNERLARLAAETRKQGYAFNDQMIVPGMSAIGVPVLGQGGLAVAALSIAAISNRFGKRRRSLVGMLNDEARLLEEHLTRILGPVTAEGLQGLGRRRVASTSIAA